MQTLKDIVFNYHKIYLFGSVGKYQIFQTLVREYFSTSYKRHLKHKFVGMREALHVHLFSFNELHFIMST